MKSIKALMTICVTFFISINLMAQSAEPSSELDGTYHLLNPERSTQGGTTKQMLLQFAERNGTQMLAAAACEKCTPAVYTYQEGPSKALGLAVFFNSFGIYMIQYDTESFIAVIPDKQLGKGEFGKIAYSNFYSKDQSKITDMTAEKIAEYAIGRSKAMMDQ